MGRVEFDGRVAPTASNIARRLDESLTCCSLARSACLASQLMVTSPRLSATVMVSRRSGMAVTLRDDRRGIGMLETPGALKEATHKSEGHPASVGSSRGNGMPRKAAQARRGVPPVLGRLRLPYWASGTIATLRPRPGWQCSTDARADSRVERGQPLPAGCERFAESRLARPPIVCASGSAAARRSRPHSGALWPSWRCGLSWHLRLPVQPRDAATMRFGSLPIIVSRSSSSDRGQGSMSRCRTSDTFAVRSRPGGLGGGGRRWWLRGWVRCARGGACGRAELVDGELVGGLIRPDEAWHLGHPDGESVGGPEHRRCNAGAPSRLGARRRREW